MNDTKLTREQQAAQALDYYDRGIPSANPDESWAKNLTEQHRWGQHGEPTGTLGFGGCPVCDRKS